MELRSGDHHGMDSRVVEVSASAGNPEELLKYCVEPPEDLDTERKTARLVGPVTIRVDAPPNAKIAWLSIGAGFRTHQLDAAAQTKNEIGYAVGEPVNFTAIYTSDVPTDQQHWHYNVDEEVVLDEPAETVYCRYVGDPALNQVRIYAHCIDDEPREPSPMVVTHTWTEDGERKRHVADLGGAADYEVQVDGEPVNESVRMQVLSDGPNAAIETDDAQAGVDTTDATDWVEAMKLVHARHAGEKGVFACFGDSITDSRAFWFSLKHARKDAPPEMVAAFQTVSGHMLDDCWDRKGAQFGNQGSMAIEWAYQNIDGWLRNLNPEAAIFMFGTNDLNNINAAKYEERLREIMQRCLDNGTVVILSTIPPRNTFEEKSAEFADVARAVADDMNLPLVDFHAEIMRRRPDDWNGALDKFAAYEGYDVPTLIARDGVHPSNPKQYSATYSDEALNNCGFALRNQMVLMKYAEVIGEVLGG